jgi:hypothetical protein
MKFEKIDYTNYEMEYSLFPRTYYEYEESDIFLNQIMEYDLIPKMYEMIYDDDGIEEEVNYKEYEAYEFKVGTIRCIRVHLPERNTKGRKTHRLYFLKATSKITEEEFKWYFLTVTLADGETVVFCITKEYETRLVDFAPKDIQKEEHLVIKTFSFVSVTEG